MRTSTLKALTLNHNADQMKEKYDISHMIAAFGYEEVGVSDGRFVSDKEHHYLDGKVFPWSLCRTLGEDLASMAGWSHNDNKVAFLVVMRGDVAIISFYDSTCTLVSWNPYWREEIPANITRGEKKVQKAYTEWRNAYMWERKLQQRAEKARTFSPIGDKVWDKCSKCQEETSRREMGTLVCDNCATRCPCGSTHNVEKSVYTSDALYCEGCRSYQQHRAEELVCDKCRCGYSAPHSYEVGQMCDNDGCIGRLVRRYPEMEANRRLSETHTHWYMGELPHGGDDHNSGVGLSYPGVWSQVESDCKALRRN